MNSRSWKKLQTKIWERDGKRCFICGENKKQLCLHHLDNSGDWNRHSKSNNESENLRTLCISCHTKEHWKKARERGYNNLLG